MASRCCRVSSTSTVTYTLTSILCTFCFAQIEDTMSPVSMSAHNILRHENREMAEEEEASDIDICNGNAYVEELSDKDLIVQERATTNILIPHYVPATLRDSYNDLHQDTIKMSKLKSVFKDNSLERSLALLNKQNQIIIDRNYLFNLLSREIHIYHSTDCVNFFIATSKGIGLAAGLPMREGIKPYSFKLNLHLPDIRFPTEGAHIGFNPTGCMLFIGSYNLESLWIAMVTDDFINEDEPLVDGDSIDIETRIHTLHYCMVIMFLIYALSSVWLLSICGVGDWG